MADNREAIMFKKVPDGYLFRAPNPYLFGRVRFYLVTEEQKARLLAIITARGQAAFWIAFIALIAVGIALLAYGTGHDDPTIGDMVIMLAMIPLSLFAAVFISVRPTARRLQPLLAELQPTDQRITSSDVRNAVRKTVSFGQYLMLGVTQAIASTALFILVWRKTGGRPASVFDDSGTLVVAFVAAVTAILAIIFLVAALDKARHRNDEPVPANKSWGGIVLQALCLLVSLGLLGFVMTNTFRLDERKHAQALIQERLDRQQARIDGARIGSRIDGLKARTAANSTRMSELTTHLNNPTVKCESSAATDDPARIESIRACRERARKEQDDIQRGMAATREETAAIQRDNLALQKDIDAIRTESNALAADIKAMRR